MFTVGKVHYNEHCVYDTLQKLSVSVLLGLICVAKAAAELVAYLFYLVKTLQQSCQHKAAADYLCSYEFLQNNIVSCAVKL